MQKIFLFTLMFISLTMPLQGQASECVCTANPYTKKYAPQGVVKTWYGGKRIWSCAYTCENTTGLKQEIRGHHREWYIGEDNGLWGICDGLVYINEYNAYAQRFIWAFNRVGTFDPTESKSPEVKSWAKENCAE